MVHIYTGNGKGKTTAAMGLAVRAAGQGKRVMIVQFHKGRETGELFSLAKIPGITVLRNRGDYGFFSALDEETRRRVIEENNENLEAAIGSGADMIILDEALGAYNNGSVSRDAIDLLAESGGAAEVILTGRNAPRHLVDAADYVSEIVKIKHPYEKGVEARKGIEF
jgi:cob(I)alamin adenosyltransferase